MDERPQPELSHLHKKTLAQFKAAWIEYNFFIQSKLAPALPCFSEQPAQPRFTRFLRPAPRSYDFKERTPASRFCMLSEHLAPGLGSASRSPPMTRNSQQKPDDQPRQGGMGSMPAGKPRSSAQDGLVLNHQVWSTSHLPVPIEESGPDRNASSGQTARTLLLDWHETRSATATRLLCQFCPTQSAQTDQISFQRPGFT